MSTTFGELKRQVLLRFPDVADGRTIMAVEQAINDAHRVIAAVNDFDELTVLDTANAATTANQSTYHIINDWNLTRPKDILSIRYMDEDNSRKLKYVPLRELDEKIPYIEILSTGRPSWYTRRGMYIQLIRIPDANNSLYIQHTQWPATLANDSDETPFINIDFVIVELATAIASSILTGVASNWETKARELLGLAVTEERQRPDEWLVAKPFTPIPPYQLGEYWNNPWVKRQLKD